MQTTRLAVRQWTLYLIVLLLFGCADVKYELAQTPAKDVLFSDQEAPSDFGAVGFLIFTKRPSGDDFDRYIAVCEAFNRNLEPVSDYPSSSWPSIMPTYWLAQNQEQIDKRFPDYRQWVELYDYSRAEGIASSFDFLYSEGPILFAWSQPSERIHNNAPALVLDLSDFSNDDLDRAFGIWMERITRNPKVWRAGFNLVLAREAFRSFLKKYGDHIIRGADVEHSEAASPPTPARDVLFSNEEAPSGFGAYGYLIFTKRPSDDNFDRYIAVCNEFLRNLEPVSDYPSSSWPSIMPTYWLAQNQGQIDKDDPDCQQWIEFYDYSRAKSIASATKVLSLEGPILVAWSQPFEKTRNDETALVLDLSDFSNDDLDRAFGIWMDRITRDPKVWNDGFNLVLAKESFRSFLEKYGDHIIRAVKTVKEIIG